MRTIKIRDIKHIKSLDFKIPSKAGVYVLTGSNGSGKTTLLACLLRIGRYRAFQDYFKIGSGRLDQFRGSITYSIEGKSVSYQYTGERWPPRPRKNSAILSQFGFPNIRFLPATGNRLFIHGDNIQPSDFKPVKQALKDNMEHLLESSKFQNLRFVQTGSIRGPGSGSQRWKRAYVIKNEQNQYYSEKNFSLGEILILNTLLLIEDVPDSSMLLIDELEMALHPRVQIKLLRYLEKIAKERKFIIILSTHSSSLIKAANNLIYLENNGKGKITTHYNCFPAKVLNEIAIEEDIQPDYLFLVEDTMAELLLKEMLNYYFYTEQISWRPVCKVLPIGGYPQVLDFAHKTHGYLFNARIGQHIFLDKDVEDERKELKEKGNNRTKSEQHKFEQFEQLETRTNYLPVTPELGLWDWIKTQSETIQVAISDHYPDCTIRFADNIKIAEESYPEKSANNREAAKKLLKSLISQLHEVTKIDEKRINDYLFKLFVKNYYSSQTNSNKLKATFGRIFSRRGNHS